MEKKIIIGKNPTDQYYHRVNDAVKSIKATLSGKATQITVFDYLGESITIDDIKSIRRDRGTTLIDRWERLMKKKIYEAPNISKRLEAEQQLENGKQIFADILSNIFTAFSSLPDFAPFELLSFDIQSKERTYRDQVYDRYGNSSVRDATIIDYTVDVAYDMDVVSENIKQLCIIYAESEEEKQIYETVSGIVDAFNGLRTAFSGKLNYPLKISSFVSDDKPGEVSINMDFLQDLFKKLKD